MESYVGSWLIGINSAGYKSAVHFSRKHAHEHRPHHHHIVMCFCYNWILLTLHSI